MSYPPLEPEENPFRKHKGIIFVVVSLGILIVLGFAGLVYGIALKASKSNAPEDGVAAPAIPTTAQLSSVVAGSTVLGMAADAGTVYLTLRLSSGEVVLRAFNAQGVQLFETPISVD